MGLRLEKYTAEIMLQHIKSHKSKYAPLVYPIVIYNGKRRYQCPTDYYDMFADPVYAREIMQHPFNVIDFTRYKNKDLLRQHDYDIVEVIFKYHASTDIVKLFKEIRINLRKMEQDGARDLVASLLTYLACIYDLDVASLSRDYFSVETVEVFIICAARLRSSGRRWRARLPKANKVRQVFVVARYIV